MTAATVATRRPVTRRRSRHLTLDNVVASMALTLLTIVTAVGMCRVFGDWRFLRPLVTMAIVVHVASLLLRSIRVAA